MNRIGTLSIPFLWVNNSPLSLRMESGSVRTFPRRQATYYRGQINVVFVQGKESKPCVFPSAPEQEKKGLALINRKNLVCGRESKNCQSCRISIPKYRVTPARFRGPSATLGLS